MRAVTLLLHFSPCVTLRVGAAPSFHCQDESRCRARRAALPPPPRQHANECPAKFLTFALLSSKVREI